MRRKFQSCFLINMSHQKVFHTQLQNYFEDIIKNNALHHAYCFVGEKGIGKKNFALWLSAKLLQTTEERLNIHPDYFFLEQEQNEKTGKLKRDIDVDQVEKLREAISRRSLIGGYKIIIIEGAEKLNKNSGNALLKTLEEPGEKTLFFLLTENEEKILPTIRSRCQTVVFQKVDTKKIEEYVLSLQISLEEAKEIAELSQGRPGIAREWAENPEAKENYKKEIEKFFALFKISFHDKKQSLEALFEESEDGQSEREKILSLLNIWLEALHQEVLRKNGFPYYNFLANHDIIVSNNMLTKLSTNIVETKKMIEQNIQSRLAIEHLLLQFP